MSEKRLEARTGLDKGNGDVGGEEKGEECETKCGRTRVRLP